jgi:GNAT superfamily N-acetyltransferase
LGTGVEYRVLIGQEAAEHLNELTGLYTEVYSEPPYEWGPEHAALFRERFDVQRRQEGFALVTACENGYLVGFGFGVTLQPTTPWWRNLLTPLPADLTTERPGRTWALVELLVRAPCRRQHVARTIHDTLLTDRPEERATLTVLPAATPAVAAYRAWGWTQVGQKRNPLPGAPVFAVMLKELRVRPRAEPA